MGNPPKGRHGNSKPSRQLVPGLPPPANPLPPASRPKKATAAEFRQRVLNTARMLLDGRRKHEIKRFFKSQYGIGARQIETYILRAREGLAEASEVDVAQMRAEFYARYMIIYREAEQDGTKIQALKAAGALYGVDAPQKVAKTTVTGKDKGILRATVEGLTVEQLRVLRDAKHRLEEISSGAR